MRVCVLLAAFDGEKYIKEQLDSIFKQSECDVIDVFVRDDCSRDGTSEVLKNYSLKKDALKVLEANSNTGKAGFNFYELIRYVPPNQDCGRSVAAMTSTTPPGCISTRGTSRTGPCGRTLPFFSRP